MKCGIYKITNTVNGKAYIGSSVNIKYRFNCHVKALESNSHHNKYLMSDFNKYGIENFSFKEIEKTNDLLLREGYWINKLKTLNRSMGYNVNNSTGAQCKVKNIIKQEVLVPYINLKELCEWLKISKSTAERWRKEGMPFTKIGTRSIRFEADKVTEWMALPKSEQK